MSPKTVLRTLAIASIAALVAAQASEAAAPEKWKQVTGVGVEDANTLNPGLARSADGVLHVLWTRDETGSDSLLHSTVSADGRSVAGPGPVASNDGLNLSSALVALPDGSLRAFFAGTNLFDGLLLSATSADGGASWSSPSPVSKLEPEGKEVYTAGGIGAATGLDGTFYSIWGDSSPSGGGYHVGLDPALADGELPNEELESDPKIGVDSSSGQVVSAWHEVGGGVGVMPLSPAAGATRIPSSDGESLHPVGITGRIGAAGVFVAYLRGPGPFPDPSLYRVDTGKAFRVTKRPGELASLAAAPGGRLWMFWKGDGNVLRATRSNKAATRFGRIVELKPPGGDATVYDLAGDASTGPLDLLAHSDPDSGPLASYHRRVRPGLDLEASKAKKGKTAVGVTDAGVAVGGATVKVKGVGKKTSGGSGKVVFALDPGRYRVTASKKGYEPYSKRVRVK